MIDILFDALDLWEIGDQASFRKLVAVGNRDHETEPLARERFRISYHAIERDVLPESYEIDGSSSAYLNTRELEVVGAASGADSDGHGDTAADAVGGASKR